MLKSTFESQFNFFLSLLINYLFINWAQNYVKAVVEGWVQWRAIMCVFLCFFAVCMGKNETIALDLYLPWVNYNRFAANGYVLN